MNRLAHWACVGVLVVGGCSEVRTDDEDGGARDADAEDASEAADAGVNLDGAGPDGGCPSLDEAIDRATELFGRFDPSDDFYLKELHCADGEYYITSPTCCDIGQGILDACFELVCTTSSITGGPSGDCPEDCTEGDIVWMPGADGGVDGSTMDASADDTGMPDGNAPDGA